MSRLSGSAVDLLKQLVNRRTSITVSHDGLFYFWGTMNIAEEKDVMSLVKAGMMTRMEVDRYVFTGKGREYIYDTFFNGEQT